MPDEKFREKVKSVASDIVPRFVRFVLSSNVQVLGRVVVWDPRIGCLGFRFSSQGEFRV